MIFKKSSPKMMVIQSGSSDSLSDDWEEDEEEEDDEQHFDRNLYRSRSLPMVKSEEQPCQLQNIWCSVRYKNHSPTHLSRHNSQSKDHPFLFREHGSSFRILNAHKAVIKPRPDPVEIQTARARDDKKEKTPFSKRVKSIIMKYLKNEIWEKFHQFDT